MTGVPKLGDLERRYRENSGQRYLRDGISIRCQAVSKTNLRRIRVERGDLELTTSDIWPEGQCDKGAVPGTFGCKFHGGKSIVASGKSISRGMIPLDLQEKIEILQQNPDYINREFEIWQLLGMNAQLHERMEELGGGPDSYEKILVGLNMIRGGDIENGIKGIQKIIESEFSQREIRDELRININLLKELTKVQVSTAKELKTMATTDQVMAMVEGIVDDFITIVKDLVVDRTLADRLVDRFVRAVKLRMNARVGTSTLEEVVDGNITE
jgi:hypothetical protein